MKPQRARKRQRTHAPATPGGPQQQPEVPAGPPADVSHIWLPEILDRLAALLPPNEVALALRLVNKAAAAHLRGPQHATIHLSQPVPHGVFALRWAGPDAIRSLTWRQSAELACLTARSGSVANLEVLLARNDHRATPHSDAVWEAAAGSGQLEVCIWLQKGEWGFEGQRELVAAAAGGQRVVCEWLLEEGNCSDDFGQAAVAAARAGQVGLMDWMLGVDRGRSIKYLACELMEAAAFGCDLPTLQRLHHAYRDVEYDADHSILANAAASPTEDWQAKVEWLEAHVYGAARPEQACSLVEALPDAAPRLQWLRQRGYSWGTGTPERAIRAGSTATVQFLLEQGRQMDPSDVSMAQRDAARGGHLAVLQLLHSLGFHINVDHVEAAAESGQIPVLTWMLETLDAAGGLTARAFASAVLAGSTELLAWLRQRGCPWDTTAFANAAVAGSEVQLEWLAEQGCPMGVDGEPYARAVHLGDTSMLRCLRRLGCPWSPCGATLVLAVEACNWDDEEQEMEWEKAVSALSFLLDQGCPADWARARAAAADNFDTSLVKWLEEQRQERGWVRGGRLRSNGKGRGR